MEKEINIVCDYEKEVCCWIFLFDDVLIVFVLVFEKQWIFKVVEFVFEVYENCLCWIMILKLNDKMLVFIDCYGLFVYCGCLFKIKYVMQLLIVYLVFVFFCNNFKYIKDSYKQYLENQFCFYFNFIGVLVSVFFWKKQGRRFNVFKLGVVFVYYFFDFRLFVDQ